MGDSDGPLPGPDADALARAFDVREVHTDGQRRLYIGRPRSEPEAVERELRGHFARRGYDLSIRPRPGSGTADGTYVLVAEPRSGASSRTRDRSAGRPRRNVALFVLTVLSTLFAGAFYWYRIPVFADPVAALRAWPFVVAIMGVLGVHELGHYVLSRYHGVDASLPYFIPLPTYIGSMGAVIRMRGPIPDRRALFDIGAAGPLAGLAATVVVTVVGLQLDPLPVQEAAAAGTGARIEFHNPPLLSALAELTGTAGKLRRGVVHPVVFGGWVGMLVTVLNMLPVGQLDGGHIVRAMVGPRQETLAAAVPGALFALAGYLLVVRQGTDSVGIWTMWGLFALVLAYTGPASPVDETPIGRPRLIAGGVTFLLCALCFTPVPIEVVA